MIIINKEPSFISNLHCFCGVAAELAWHAPLRKEDPKKMSKTQDASKYKPEIHPMGWSCNNHIPKEIQELINGSH